MASLPLITPSDCAVVLVDYRLAWRSRQARPIARAFVMRRWRWLKGLKP